MPDTRPSKATTRGERANSAVEAEPTGVGSSRARDELAREIKLLGSLLGQVIAEQAGEELLALVERVRKLTIDIRKTGSATRQLGLRAILEDLSSEQIEALIKAFSLYFHLTNLAEEKHRVRRVRLRAHTRGGQEGSLEAAVRKLLGEDEPEQVRQLIDDLNIGLVLTAHPTEARRRTILVALRRTSALIDRLDDPRLTPNEDKEIRRQLREEISLLWRTSPLRSERPAPLDEVRRALLFFDETIFRVTPYLYRTLDRVLDIAPWVTDTDGAPNSSGPASDTGHTGTRPPVIRPYLHWGSWVGSDRDGHPRVTAETTRAAAAIGADHVLRGLEHVATRLMNTVTASERPDGSSAAVVERLRVDAEELPDLFEDLLHHFPREPYRQRFGCIAERLRRTRRRLVDGNAEIGSYASPEALLMELTEIQDSLVAEDLGRIAWGEVQNLRWQLETFGFHAFSLEVRQHSEVHRSTLAAISEGVDPGAREVASGVTAAEVLETYRAIAEIQRQYGPASCQRYVISFTEQAQDVYNVLQLADVAGLARESIDVVPLLETAVALEGADTLLDEILGDASYRQHVRDRGDHQEVMLGYSDSTKESGALAAAWLLHGAESKLAAAAERHGVRLTLFHGRGGAIGRGGGPMGRAILASAPHSLAGTLKLTEQGEIVADRYANFDIAMRHLAQLTNAVLVASSRAHQEHAQKAHRRGSAILGELAERSARAYQALVWKDPAFEAYYVAATPIGELSGLAIGSRPAARGGGAVSLEKLRAIPWVFSWAQARAFLPGWYGLGSAVEEFERVHGQGSTGSLQELYRDSPFFTGVIDVIEMALAKVDLAVAEHYASLAPKPDADRIWAQIQAEYDRTQAAVLRITGRDHLLDAAPTLQRSIQLRNPYVDSLSELQVMLLGRLRALPDDDPGRDELRRLVQLTVSGVAAGLQNTG